MYLLLCFVMFWSRRVDKGVSSPSSTFVGVRAATRLPLSFQLRLLFHVCLCRPVTFYFSSFFLIFLFALLVRFYCEVNGGISWCFSSCSHRKSLNRLLVNWTPLPVRSTFVTPKIVRMLSQKARKMPSSVALRTTMVSTHFENLSRETRVIEWLCFDRNSEPTKSAQTVAHGSSAIWVSILTAACCIFGTPGTNIRNSSQLQTFLASTMVPSPG